MRVAISSAALRQIREEARRSPDREICGLLFGNAGAIEHIEPCRNVAANPAMAFEIDPARLIAAHRAMRSGGAQMIGHYHSHPSGVAIPSARDAAAAPADGALWLIAAGDGVQGWCAIEHGAVEARFDPVELVATPPGCASGAGSPQGRHKSPCSGATFT